MVESSDSTMCIYSVTQSRRRLPSRSGEEVSGSCLRASPFRLPVIQPTVISMQTCLRLPVESAWVWVRAEESFRESRIPAECSHVQEVEQEEERAEMRVVRRWISHQVDSSAWPRNLAGNQV
jgi:hypothetical protein